MEIDDGSDESMAKAIDPLEGVASSFRSVERQANKLDDIQ